MDKQAFFSTAAQIIPVFLLTLTLSDRLLLADFVTGEVRAGSPKRMSSKTRARFMQGVLLTMVASEVFAIGGSTGDVDSAIALDVLQGLVLIGLVVGLVGIATVGYVRIEREISKRPSNTPSGPSP